VSSLAGPLTFLSLRRAGHHFGPKQTPQPPTNPERYCAYLHACASLRQLPHRNDYQWPLKRSQ
jgi:hypothetical protein